MRPRGSARSKPFQTIGGNGPIVPIFNCSEFRRRLIEVHVVRDSVASMFAAFDSPGPRDTWPRFRRAEMLCAFHDGAMNDVPLSRIRRGNLRVRALPRAGSGSCFARSRRNTIRVPVHCNVTSILFFLLRP